MDFFDRYSLNYLPVCRTCLQLPMEVRYGNGPQNNINIQTMLMNLNLVLIILMIKNSLSVYGFYERRLNMRGTRFIKTIAALVFAAILVTCIPFKLFADSLPRSVSLEASEGVTAEFAIENSWAGYFNGYSYNNK